MLCCAAQGQSLPAVGLSFCDPRSDEMKQLRLCSGNDELDLFVNSALPPSPLPPVRSFAEAQGLNHESGAALYGRRAMPGEPLALSCPGLGLHETVKSHGDCP